MKAAIALLLALAACGAAAPEAAPARKEGAMPSAVEPSAVEIERRIEAAAPAGTPAADVVAWLAREGVENSGPVEGGRLVEAIWRGVERRGLVTRSVQARIHFDAAGRRAALEVRDVHTGP
jgi:hypothetical protein